MSQWVQAVGEAGIVSLTLPMGFAVRISQSRKRA